MLYKHSAIEFILYLLIYSYVVCNSLLYKPYVVFPYSLPAES